MSDIYKIAAEYLTMVAEEVYANDPHDSQDDYRDAIMEAFLECIDGCHEVIYTYAAWDLVANHTSICETAAEDMGVDMAATVAERGLSGLMSLLAYCGLYAAGMDQMEEVIR